MAKQVVAVFLMCMVVVAAMQLREAEATGEVYKACYESCQKDCSDTNGYTFCEMKCDTDCGAKELSAKMEEYVKSTSGKN